MEQLGCGGRWFSDGAIRGPGCLPLLLGPVSVGVPGPTFPSSSCALVPLRPHQDKTDTVRCIKSCRPNDVTCMLDPVHTISHTVVSLSTFREFTRPEGKW